MTMYFSMQKIVAHVCKAITNANAESRKIFLNTKKPRKSTGDMRPWSTKKPVSHNKKSHTNLGVFDFGYEIKAGEELERNKHVISWAKNTDHTRFLIPYLYKGTAHNYLPDFLIRLDNGNTLVLEMKGIEDEQDREKYRSLEEWIDVVNEDGNHGSWSCDIAYSPSEVRNIIEKHAKAEISAKVFAKCPACNKSSSTKENVDKEFGFRNIDGIIRPQSWCRACRKLQTKTA